ncbi:aldehyde dehydrogenase family protein [Mycobacterium avium]|jgi:aldehyde dehydrogenase (NAD+)|uniref:aldehyde dehydrogenase family protein n=1 Tax=Mycobacterium avium TaxID=1764 RepID=UPI00049F90E7|nr:aldehyde dehydrogenase family protein [Mycobacterium avium]KDP06979.1 betaine-aldehyde dehydrogenase [Mycobacterium avium subsp. hominissuis 101]MBZ4508192.1 aldehyde dehydrogenase [Mycobacterium avium subsp. hominissuis]MBZ4517184.1 aldehyde dehydrogenase [Mycobacterium avium subsp. hominissuis]MBZ4527221.1 aldehyde dehydrogenase [Mycobacterium avium subsp. hominissuis]MBZ4546569.1 aldehyde dehydrogenase [Mycobacterium avium subsp. hominissuis]
MTSSVDVERPSVELRIGAERLRVGSAGVHQHVDPTTGRPDADVPLAGRADVERAVQVAHEAYLHWRRTKPADRRRVLMRFADLIEAHAEDFARTAALDNGTPVGTSALLVPVAVEWTRYYAGWADKISSEVTASLRADGEFSYTLAQPWGVIGAIITWNGPLISLAMKVPAALAAGNTVVIKPSELTPFTAGLFADLAAEAGIPDGVINVVPGGAEAGAALVAHPLVKKISFTGGPDTARKILHTCADLIKPAVMELGGKSGNIVFADADLDTACGIGTMMSVAILSGQGCAFPTRMLVERSVYDEVIERVRTIAGFVKVGNPFEADTVSGPVVNEQALVRITGMIERASRDGARLVTGGGRLGGELAGGYYLEPTVFADVDPQSELAQNEVFGPVLSIIPFDDEAQAIEITNGTPYGLSGYVFTNDLRRAHRVAEELETGEVLINGAANLGATRPFGGIGISGMGKEGGRQGLEEFLHIKTVSMA